MNMTENRAELDCLNRAPEVTSVTGSTPRPLAPLESAGDRSTTRTVAVSAQPATAPMHGIARDENSSQLVNFRYAITAFATLGTGLLAMCCGIVDTSVWLTVVGFILTLVGGEMYGSSLYDD